MLVDNSRWATVPIDCDLRHQAPEQDFAAGRFDGPGERVAQALGATPDLAATRAQVSALRDGERDPPQRAGIIVIIGEVGGESALHRFVVAEAAIKALCGRKAPAFHHRTETGQGQEPSMGLRKAWRPLLNVPNPVAMRSISPSTEAILAAADGKHSRSACRAGAKPSGNTNGSPTGPPRTSLIAPVGTQSTSSSTPRRVKTRFLGSMGWCGSLVSCGEASKTRPPAL